MSSSHNNTPSPPPSRPTPWRITGWTLLFAVMMLIFPIMTVLTMVAPRPRSLEAAAADRRAQILAADKEAQLTQLNSYGWVDKDKKIAHIPIQEAMTKRAAESSSPAKP